MRHKFKESFHPGRVHKLALGKFCTPQSTIGSRCMSPSCSSDPGNDAYHADQDVFSAMGMHGSQRWCSRHKALQSPGDFALAFSNPCFKAT
mmetsp:Transcript_43767/g.131178  ORF Transcript_43767/g.131178 Transcript_43767/m.131178 type:complete len:91 (+) Transcript_43767:883-1155(+)